MKKTGMNWIEFNFDAKEKSVDKKIHKGRSSLSEGCFNEEKQSTLLERTKSSFNFELKLKPENITDVAVHPKKIKEVEYWLQSNVVKNRSSQTAAFLLVTGPAGSGKTTTLQVLCKNMSISLSEWTNPVDQDFEIWGQNQICRFIDFLTESKWNSLFEVSDKKVIVVEEFPNTLIRNPSEMDRVLEECYYKGNYPIVFICSESFDGGSSSPESLFPQELRQKYNMCHISFNACATRLLKNALKRAHVLVRNHLGVFKAPSVDAVDAIVASSLGDIRCAISQYYFASLLGKQTNKRKRSENFSVIKTMSKDEILGLFHGLGRVLNPKRVEAGSSWRLNCNIENLIDEFGSQPGTFTSFLFENYLKYFGELNDVCKAAEILSLSQTFLEKWTDHHDTLIFAMWISVMGLMIYNEHRTSKWNQIRGPRKVKKKLNTDENTKYLSAVDLFYYNVITRKDIIQFKSDWS